MKRCVIIGSGLGGLSCGYVMARNGYRVTVLEQGSQPGGCLQCFSRGDAVFDTGMHFIGSADKGQTLYRIMNYMGIDQDIQLNRLDPMGYDVICYRGKRYHMANGREAFIDTLCQDFPDSRGDLERYCDLIGLVASASMIHTLSWKKDININAEYQLRSVNEVLDSVVRDPLLREVLVGALMLYAGEKDHTPFSTHALITDCYNQSAFRIVGGSSKVADSLVHSIQSMAGQVLLNQRVTQIVCDSSKATTVVTHTGDSYPADLVISNIHPATTLSFIDSHLIRPVYRARVTQLRNTVGAFTVYLKFKPNTVPYMNSNLYLYTGDQVWGCEHYTEHSWPKSLLYMHFCHQPNPTFAHTGEILTYMNFDEMTPWLGTTVGHRGADYEAFKQRKAEQAIDALAREVPDLRDHIADYYTSTPLTYLDYTGVPQGSMYGVARDVQAAWAGRIGYRTRIPNLLFTGQNISLHGMMGVMAGSLMTCAEVLSLKTIFEQLKVLE